MASPAPRRPTRFFVVAALAVAVLLAALAWTFVAHAPDAATGERPPARAEAVETEGPTLLGSRPREPREAAAAPGAPAPVRTPVAPLTPREQPQSLPLRVEVVDAE